MGAGLPASANRCSRCSSALVNANPCEETIPPQVPLDNRRAFSIGMSARFEKPVMRRNSSCPASARLRRLVHIVVVILFAFYIGADAADINLSDSPSEQNSSDYEVAVTEELGISELGKSVDHNHLRAEAVADFSTLKINCNVPLRTSSFRTTPRRIYRRVTFARSPTPQSPSA